MKKKLPSLFLLQYSKKKKKKIAKNKICIVYDF